MSRGRAALRIAQVTLTVVGGTLVVPIAVNVGTGGSPPGWLRPLQDWLWPAAIACVAAVIVLELAVQFGPGSDRAVPHPVGDPRNGPLALDQVHRYVSARQDGSLAARIALALDERPAAVRQPAHLVARVSGDAFTLSPDLGIADVFARMHESMLILGAPGAGKTTQLLDLAEALVSQQRRVAEPLVPVLLDLADWARPRSGGLVAALFGGAGDPPPLGEWVVSALWRRYRVPEAIGREWLATNRLVLLLDGLDEVGEDHRARCVAEINALPVTRTAVCCREADYDEVGARLRLQGAVTIRPLTRDQVMAFLAAADPAVERAMSGAAADDPLWEVLTTPLTLSIIVLAHAAPGAMTGKVGRRDLLFDAYTVEVLARPRARDTGEPERILRALKTLAEASVRAGAGVSIVSIRGPYAFFSLSRPVVRVLAGRLVPLAYLGAVPIWLTSQAALTTITAAAAPAVAVTFALRGALRGRPLIRAVRRPPVAAFSAAAGLLAGLLVALPVGFVALAGDSRAALAVTTVLLGGAIAAIIWWFERQSGALGRATRRVMGAVVAASVLVAAALVALGLDPLAGRGWAVGFGTGVLLSALVITLAAPRAGVPAVTVPRRRNLALAGAVAAVSIAGIAVFARTATPFAVPAAAWAVGALHGVVPGALFARLALPWVGRSAAAAIDDLWPLSAGFLRLAVDRGLLSYVDGEYRFVHLLLRDHLATCNPFLLSFAVASRKRELAPSAPDV